MLFRSVCATGEVAAKDQTKDEILSLFRVNEMIPWTKDGYAHLELRYNNNGSQGRLVPGMVSFKLDDYSPENSELKGIKVLVNPVDGEEKTYIFSYPLTGEDVPGFNPLDLAELK